MRSHNGGFASISVFAFILFFSVLFIVLAANQHRVVNLTDNLRKDFSDREMFFDEIDSVCSVLANDESRHSFSAYDPVYDYIEEISDNWDNVVFSECSSLPNPNFYPLSFWEDSSLDIMIIDRAFWDNWEYQRLEEGFIQDLSFWESVLVYDEKNPHFSLYSFINVNITSVSVLEAYSKLNNQDPEQSAVWIDEIQRKRRENTGIRESDLAAWLGEDREKLPLLSSRSPININMASPEILGAVLSLISEKENNDDFKYIKDKIIMRRVGHEIDKPEWDSIVLDLSEKKRYKIKKWLGVQSWIWLIDLEKDELFCRAVIAQFYSEKNDQYQIVVLDLDWSDIQ